MVKTVQVMCLFGNNVFRKQTQKSFLTYFVNVDQTINHISCAANFGLSRLK